MKISVQKKEKISEQILSMLFHIFPQSRYTAEIARDLARDEEFTKAILTELKNKGLVNAIKKNESGLLYSRRIRWMISPSAHTAYQQI